MASSEVEKGIETMDGKAKTVKTRAAVADFLQLGANAFASGLLVAIALAVITLALATSAQAASTCAGASSEEPRSAASTPADEDAAGVGALWANLLFGTVALSSAGIVAFLGRTIPAGRN